MDRTSSRWLFYLRFYSMLKISKSACTTTVRTIHLISSLGSSYELQCWSFVVEEYLPRLGLLFRHHQYFKNWIMEWEFKTRLLGLLVLPPYCLSFSYSDGVAIVVGSGIGGTEAASSKSGGNIRLRESLGLGNGQERMNDISVSTRYLYTWVQDSYEFNECIKEQESRDDKV